MMGLKAALLVLAILIGICTAIPRNSEKSNVHVSCQAFTSTDFTGYSTEIRESVANLKTYNMDNLISSAIISGVWLFYTDVQFNSNLFGNSAFAWGESLRIPSFGNFNRAISSLRHPGVRENMKESTINVYEGLGFMGRGGYSINDKPYIQVDNFGKSIIITGCEPWTLYEHRNYRGDRICLYPSSTERCEPGFYVEPKDFGNFGNKMSSIKKGCYSKKVFKGISVPANTTKMFSAN